MKNEEQMSAYEFCEWLYMYLHTHDSEYVSKAVISEKLDRIAWIRMKEK
jgi:hypothetical protein